MLGEQVLFYISPENEEIFADYKENGILRWRKDTKNRDKQMDRLGWDIVFCVLTNINVYFLN